MMTLLTPVSSSGVPKTPLNFSNSIELTELIESCYGLGYGLLQ